MARVEAGASKRASERERAVQCEERVAHKKWRFPTQANREKICRTRETPSACAALCVSLCVSESERKEKKIEKKCVEKNAN